MFKRVLMVFILAFGVLALRSGEVDAHLAGTVYNPTYRHIASYDCTGTFAQIPSLTQHPALFECDVEVHEFQVVCANPEGKIVTPGIPSDVRVGQFASGLITQSLKEKKKGKATTTVLLPDTVKDAGDVICSERNHNWIAGDELVLSADVTLRTYDCPGGDCDQKVQAFEALLHCTVPDCPNDQPCSLPDNPPPQGIPWDYDCDVLAEAHCDEGDFCPITP